MFRLMDTHQYTPAPYNQIGYDGSIKVVYVNNIATTWAISRPTSYPVSPYPTSSSLVRGKGFTLSPAQPNLQMDPSDSATWQRPYRFTN